MAARRSSSGSPSPYAVAAARERPGPRQRFSRDFNLIKPRGRFRPFIISYTAPIAAFGDHVHERRHKPLIETFDAEILEAYAKACGWVLARAHAKVSEVTPIAGYLGTSSDTFDEAMGRFGIGCADQAERDHAALKKAVRPGKIAVYSEG